MTPSTEPRLPSVPPRLAASPSWSRAVLLLLALGVVSVIVLFSFDPAQNSFYPRCTIKQLTGLDCPGCGGLRATHQLLHGQVLAAFRLNPLFVTLAPLAAAWLAWAGVQIFRRRTFPEIPLTPRRVWLLVAVTLGFSVLRNMPGSGL